MVSQVTNVISILIILMSLSFAYVLAFTDQMQEELSGTKRSIFIFLLVVYSFYRGYRLMVAIREKKQTDYED